MGVINSINRGPSCGMVENDDQISVEGSLKGLPGKPSGLFLRQ